TREPTAAQSVAATVDRAHASSGCRCTLPLKVLRPENDGNERLLDAAPLVVAQHVRKAGGGPGGLVMRRGTGRPWPRARALASLKIVRYGTSLTHRSRPHEDGDRDGAHAKGRKPGPAG